MADEDPGKLIRLTHRVHVCGEYVFDDEWWKKGGTSSNDIKPYRQRLEVFLGLDIIEDKYWED